MSSNVKVVVVGSCMTDLVSYTSRLPNPGETIHGHKFNIGFGGKGANQCIMATRLGASTAMVAKVGKDSFGENYLENFRNNKVDITHVGVTDEASTGVAPIAVDDSGENCIIIVAGANLKMSVEDIKNAEKMISEASIVVCQGEITMEATKAALVTARRYKVKTLMNVAPAIENLDPEIYKNSDIFCVNESEASVCTGLSVKDVNEAKVAATKLLSLGCGSVIITLGEEGALYTTKDGSQHITTEKVRAVDTTGAGDAFVGALAYYFAYYPALPVTEMISRACRVASISVQAQGTQSSYPSRDLLPQVLFA
ncbi:unnamed protein product [Meganyctiphanes norvegica]|uniref:Ribokinase n=1 Tax=Meganyctiphanes norvegica TaxID=48144 RepID=A0AAV2PWU2_MEGNR